MSKKLLRTLLTTTLICQLSFGQAISNTTGNQVDENNLTDQEKWTSENYFHEGKASRILEEECRNGDAKTQEICDGRDPNAKKAMMVKALTQMYTMIVTVIPDMGKISKSVDVKPTDGTTPKAGAQNGPTAKSQAPGNTPNANNTGTNNTNGTNSSNSNSSSGKPDEEKSRNDYCRFIATATEGLAMFQQQLGQTNIGGELKEETAQRQALEKAYLSHKERAKTAKIQTLGWGGTTACYVAMAAKPMVTGQADWKTYLKTAAAATLTVYYNGVIGDHEDYMAKVQSIKNRLPKAGDCNPITEKDCYCSEPSTQWDTQHCEKQIKKKLIAENSVYVSCVDNNMKVDEDCSCEQSDTCYDRKVLDTMVKFSGPNIVGSKSLESLNSLFTGELKNGKISGTPDANLLAMAKKALKDQKFKITSKVPLSNDQKEVFEGLKLLGVDNEVAKSLAAMPYDENSAANTAKFTNPNENAANVKTASTGNSRSNVITFTGGSGLNKDKSNKKKDDFNFKNYFDKQLKGKKNQEAGQENVLKFAERAQQGAQITKDTSRPIFDIVSRRYQVSGWRRLEVKE